MHRSIFCSSLLIAMLPSATFAIPISTSDPIPLSTKKVDFSAPPNIVGVTATYDHLAQFFPDFFNHTSTLASQTGIVVNIPAQNAPPTILSFIDPAQGTYHNGGVAQSTFTLNPLIFGPGINQTRVTGSIAWGEEAPRPSALDLEATGTMVNTTSMIVQGGGFATTAAPFKVPLNIDDALVGGIGILSATNFDDIILAVDGSTILDVSTEIKTSNGGAVKLDDTGIFLSSGGDGLASILWDVKQRNTSADLFSELIFEATLNGDLFNASANWDPNWVSGGAGQEFLTSSFLPVFDYGGGPLTASSWTYERDGLGSVSVSVDSPSSILCFSIALFMMGSFPILLHSKTRLTPGTRY